MQINAISNNYSANYKYNNQNFNGLLKDKSALPVIKKMSKSDIVEFKQIEKRLSKTKFWDIKISSIGNSFKEFKFKFINKKSNNSIITDGIYPYDRDGKIIKFYSIIYGPENTSLSNIETLHFESEKRAEKLYDEYLQNSLYARSRGYNITPLESLKMKEVELVMLEEASKTTNGKRKNFQVNTEFRTKTTTGNDLLFKDSNK